MPAYTIDADALHRLRREHGITSTRALARQMDVSPSTAHRVLTGQQAPGPRFIAGLRRAFPDADVYALVREADVAA
ncbi:MAG: helix-turn-helix domain-containing protein [Brachybacterium sp.]|uniref:helix-turn-helix domain-containing protein n=1 Tax=Brachybacterium sp. TaxID=1891286 RepID=UPI00264788BF|nr:helix-turn-helix transcriptional regulator [Brachybacterium sp.]MDN5687785.1 helix-turn-helix domain-containing protein [Brachybacterium sp.]